MTRFIYHLLDKYYKGVKLNYFGVKVSLPFPSPNYPPPNNPQLILFSSTGNCMEDFKKGVEGIIRL